MMKSYSNLLSIKLSVLTLSILALTACAANLKLTSHEKELKELNKLHKKADNKPVNHRMDYVFEQQQLLNQRILQAEQARSNADFKKALELYEQVLDIDPYNVVAHQNILKIKQFDQVKPLYDLAKESYDKGNLNSAQIILKEVLQAVPDWQDALTLKFDIERELNRRTLNPPLINERLAQRVSLEFRNASVQSVIESLSQYSGINFILDKDTKLDQTTTIYAKETTVQEALDMIIHTSGLGYKMLNANTFLIYQNTPEKKKNYEELITRSFYLGNVDSQKAQEVVGKLYEPKSMFFDDKLRLLIVRDSKQVVDSIEKLLEAYDLPMSEVILDIEVLEVNRDTLLNLGIDFPKQIGVSALNGLGEAGKYTINQIKDMTTNSLVLKVADPMATVNFRQTSNKTNLLANPRIRVKSREEASFLIGDKVPVITTTIGESSNFVAESVNYLDVGLKVEVKPEVNKDKQVQIAIKLEVSNVAKEIPTKNGLVYQIGTRNASTTLQLHDGETQMLAGLIRDDIKSSATHLPGLGKIPLLGRLFSNTTDSKNKSEIVLLITPRIVRPYAVPAPHVQEFISGTGSQVTTRPLRLSDQSNYSPYPQKMSNEAKGEPSTQEKNEPRNGMELNNQANEKTTDTKASSPVTEYVGGNLTAQFQLSGPSIITRGQEFTIALIQNTPAFQEMSVDMRHPDTWELVKTVNIAPISRMDQEKIDKGTRLSFGHTPKHQGPLALLTFKVSDQAELKKEELILENGKVKFSEGSGFQRFSDRLVKEFETKP
ncbi:secretin and TonB N-terminal domain-containing protein [Acinetobacter dispersus]|uniref:secretin and TonB N-terminal domain-containing protein n=1 Tax=Acinetobacter dispersus TaxID=70348 RepID=UPI001D18CC05|nr:secretin and TonB N-terminal domain-containing protein [Acinetobacter dispersus]